MKMKYNHWRYKIQVENRARRGAGTGVQMKLYGKKTGLLAILVLSLLLLLSACSSNREQEKLDRLEQDGYVCKVTIDFCGGTAGGKEKQLYYTKLNSLMFTPGASNTNTESPVRSGYHVKEYYVREKATDGSETERVWNFDKDRITEDLTLYCRWAKNYSVRIRYGEDFAKTSEVSVSDEDPSVSRFTAPKWEGHTLIGYYYDEAYTQPVTFPYIHAHDDANPDETVYAKFIEGNYRVISKPSDLKSVSAGANYYLLNDIDMSEAGKISFPDTYSGQFLGNGHKILNLTVEKNQSKTGTIYGLFNRLASGAVLRDVTFENLQVKVNLNNLQNQMLLQMGALAGLCDDGATVENVTLSGTFTYDCNNRQDLVGKIESANNAFGDAPAAASEAVTSTVTVTAVNEYKEDN